MPNQLLKSNGIIESGPTNGKYYHGVGNYKKMILGIGAQPLMSMMAC